MAIVAITSSTAANARPYIQSMEAAGAETRLLLPQPGGSVVPAAELLDGAGGLLLTGGPDVDPKHYGQETDPAAGVEVFPGLDELELGALDYALRRDMPVLAICRGMQLLNVAFGGGLIQDLPHHRAAPEWRNAESVYHQIYLAPGAKAAAVIGMAGLFKVNSRHHQGLTEAQRAPRLMSTAYSVDDGYVEGLESPEHSWVIGLQCHPERQDEVPRLFANLFAGLHERADRFAAAGRLNEL